MDNDQEYEKLLKSVFESCDTTGSGLLSPTEFKELCSQLSLEDEYQLLYDTLFTPKSSLSYDNFREGLLLLLAGALTDKGCDDVLKPVNSLRHSTNDLMEYSNDDLYHHGNQDLSDNKLNEKNSQNIVQSKPNKTYLDGNTDSDWLVINFCDDNKNHFSIVEGTDTNYDVKTFSSPPTRYKKYGRRSQPELGLLRPSSQSCDVDNRPKYLQTHQTSELNDVRIESDHRSLPLKIAEEYVGEGDGSLWSNPSLDDPDHEVVMSVEVSNDESDLQERLSVMWRQIVGCIDELINVEQLQLLFRALSLTSSSDDVKQLFDILDADNDGFICFGDFSRQFSTVLMGDNEGELSEERNDYCDVVNLNNQERFDNNQGKHSTPVMYGRDGMQAQIMVTSPHISSDVHTSIVTSTPSIPSASRMTSSLNSQNINPFSLSPSCGENTSTSIASSGHPSSSSIFCDEDDGMKSYHGAPSYRRRKRSNHPSTRQHRCRSSMTTSLPHYHPISQRRLESCPLYFLTQENGRYVEIESLKEIWTQEGIEDADHVIEELGVSFDDSFSIEALSEVLDTEVKENIVHQAACALYKQGIRYYRDQREHENLEKQRLEMKMEHLDCQLREQEERIQDMEVDHKEQLKILEHQYKTEVERLSQELGDLNNQCVRRNDVEINRLQERVDALQEIEIEVKKQLIDYAKEKAELLLRHNNLISQLQNSESKVKKMKLDFNKVCRQMALYSQSHSSHQERMKVVWEMYTNGARELQDNSDELMGQIENLKRSWWSRDQNESNQLISEVEEEKMRKISQHHSSAEYTSTPSTSHAALLHSDTAFTSLTESETRYTSTLSWRIAHDPDASLSQLTSADASSTNNLFDELNFSPPGGVS